MDGSSGAFDRHLIDPERGKSLDLRTLDPLGGFGGTLRYQGSKSIPATFQSAGGLNIELGTAVSALMAGQMTEPLGYRGNDADEGLP